MKFLYEFIAGNSRITPVGLAVAAGAAAFAVRNGQPVIAGAAFVAILLATLAGSVLEKER